MTVNVRSDSDIDYTRALENAAKSSRVKEQPVPRYSEVKIPDTIEVKKEVEVKVEVPNNVVIPPNPGTVVEYKEEPPVDIQYIEKPIISPEYQRIGLPSNFVFYTFKDLQIRTLKLKDLAKIWKAQTERSFTPLVDALDSTISENIRSLTISDFRMIMLWQRYYSYPKSPFTVPWKSMYGDRVETQVPELSKLIVTPTITKEELDFFKSKGIDIPKLRDEEFIENEKLDAEKEYIYNIAKYLDGDNLEEKFNRVKNAEDLDLIYLINEFKEKSDHGIKTYFKAYNNKFNPEKALAFLETTLKILQQSEPATEIQFAATIEQVVKITKEIERIKLAIETKQTISPLEEEVEVDIGTHTFFPVL